MELIGHTSAIYALAFSPKGSILVSGDYRGAVRIWNIETGQSLGVLLPERDIQCFMAPLLSFSPDGDFLVTGPACKGDRTRIWNFKERKELIHWAGTELSSLAWNNDGKLLAFGNNRETLYESATAKIFKKLEGEPPDWVMSLAWSADNQYLAAGSTMYDPAILVWHVDTGTLHTRTSEEFSTRGGNVEQIVFKNEKTLLYNPGYGTVYGWDVETGETKVVFDADSDQLGDTDYHSTISSDGRLIAYGKQEGYQEQSIHQREDGSYWTYFQPFDGAGHDVHVTDIATRTRLFTFKAHEDDLGCLVFNQDSRYLASGGLDGRLHVWDLSQNT